MQNRSHAYLVRTQVRARRFRWWCKTMPPGHKRVGAHDWNGNLPLIKHNCTSGRTHVSKRGVSLDAPDSYQRHTRVDSSGRGRCPWTLSSSNSMLYIRYITLVWYLWCDILHCYCDLLKLIYYVLYESKCAFDYCINVFTLPGFT